MPSGARGVSALRSWGRSSSAGPGLGVSSRCSCCTTVVVAVVLEDDAWMARRARRRCTGAQRGACRSCCCVERCSACWSTWRLWRDAIVVLLHLCAAQIYSQGSKNEKCAQQEAGGACASGTCDRACTRRHAGSPSRARRSASARGQARARGRIVTLWWRQAIRARSGSLTCSGHHRGLIRHRQGHRLADGRKGAGVGERAVRAHRRSAVSESLMRAHWGGACVCVCVCVCVHGVARRDVTLACRDGGSTPACARLPTGRRCSSSPAAGARRAASSPSSSTSRRPTPSRPRSSRCGTKCTACPSNGSNMRSDQGNPSRRPMGNVPSLATARCP